MIIKNHSFDVFDRDNFVYRVGDDGSLKVKEEYMSAWNDWKEIVKRATEASNSEDLVVENTEHWQNSGNLRRFWSRIKDSDLFHSPSCIAAMISKDNVRTYLEWHGYKNEKLVEERKQHNSWLSYITNWINEMSINTSEYKVWTNKEDDENFENYPSLESFISNSSLKQQTVDYLNSDNKHWVRVGKVYTKEMVLNHEDFTAEMGRTISDLEWLYKKSTASNTDKQETKYWLFNVYYANDPTVWEKCNEFDVVAMQYEYGRESSSSVTKHINTVKQIEIGDYVVAYTGNKGLLGYGKVTKTYFEEDNPEKYIHVNGAQWKQRVGVDWKIALSTPVWYKGSTFVEDLGLESNTVMGHSTIFDISLKGFSFAKRLIDGECIKNEEPPSVSQSELPTHIHSYIKSKGFNYSLEEIKNLYLSIKTKPFVILSGISGTGKTKIVQWLAESVGATEENKQFTLIPVRPDWNDGSDLLGYVDIKGEFKPGPLTKIIQEAEKNPNLPYFVLLDEMNLARVEHYFSDMLSVMESRKWKDGKMVTTPLLTEETAKRNITLPSNVYVLGTVNMDETTHPFSKKVLDRANTIEFNTVELGNLSFLEDLEEVEPKKASNNMFFSEFLHLKDIYVGNEEFVRKVTNELEEINSILQPTNSHVGYRVRDEISFYLYYNEINKFLKYKEAFDFCILQKILPRLSGSDQRTEEMLQNLYKHFTGREYTSLDEKDIKEAKYPKSANKVVEMLRRLQDGFTSFWIS